MLLSGSIELLNIERDVDDIVDIHRADIGYAGPGRNVPDDWYKMGGPWMERSLAASYFKTLRENHCRVFVFRHHGKVIAEAEIEPFDADKVFLGLLIVHPANRRQGIGRALLEFIGDQLEHEGISQIVTCPEKEAEGFYNKMDYRTLDRRIRLDGRNSRRFKTIERREKWTWDSCAPPSGRLDMIAGYNQPSPHHDIIFNMSLPFSNPHASEPIKYFHTRHRSQEVVLGLYDTGANEDDDIWAFAWGDVHWSIAVEMMEELIEKRSYKNWFTYLSQEQANQLTGHPKNTLSFGATEEWWVSDLL